MNERRFRSWVEISRGLVASNFRAIRQTVGEGVELAPVVKSDAYRHGAAEVSRLLDAEGARWFCVSNAEEGIELRESGIARRVLVMASYLAAEGRDLHEWDLTPVLHSLEEIAAWNQIAQTREQPAPYHLKLDTGMGRLGTLAGSSEIAAAIRRYKWARCEGLMTHLASPGDYDSRQTESQLGRFRAVCSELAASGIEPRYFHLCSSVPVAFGNDAAWGNMIRPGIALYGYVPEAKGSTAPAGRLDVRPVLSWKAAVLAVKDLPAGAPVGYNSLYVAPGPMRIAVIAAGYADGVPHQLSNRGSAIVAGRKVRMAGAVSMDLTTLDVTACGPVKPGDTATLIGQEGEASIDAGEIARLAGTISYNVLCGIHARVRRVYT